MEEIEDIYKWFPNLSNEQFEKLRLLEKLYSDWNSKINLISRKDISALFPKHIVHSLVIGHWISFSNSSNILDVGTGGGFPGIPLAILFPNCNFCLVDSTKKKIGAVTNIADELDLKNISTRHARVEEIEGRFDFILARAVAPAEKLIIWTKDLLSENQRNVKANGWIFLKGGDLNKELEPLNKNYLVEKTALLPLIKNEHYENKYLVYLTVK